MPKPKGAGGRFQAQIKTILEDASQRNRQVSFGTVRKRLKENLGLEGLKGHYVSELLKRFGSNEKYSHLMLTISPKRRKMQGIGAEIMRTAYHNPEMQGEKLAAKILEGIKDKALRERFSKFWQKHPKRVKRLAREARIYLKEDVKAGKVLKIKEEVKKEIKRPASQEHKKTSPETEKADNLITALLSKRTQDPETASQIMVLDRAKATILAEEDSGITGKQRQQAIQLILNAEASLKRRRII